jgi:hypothetical protein
MQPNNPFYFKTLDSQGEGPFSFWEWPKPSPMGKPGAWTPKIPWGELKACHRGYHVTDISQLIRWLSDRLYVVEVKPRAVRYVPITGEKLLAPQARLVRTLPWERWDTIDVYLRVIKQLLNDDDFSGYHRAVDSLWHCCEEKAEGLSSLFEEKNTCLYRMRRDVAYLQEYKLQRSGVRDALLIKTLESIAKILQWQVHPEQEHRSAVATNRMRIGGILLDMPRINIANNNIIYRTLAEKLNDIIPAPFAHLLERGEA